MNSLETAQEVVIHQLPWVPDVTGRGSLGSRNVFLLAARETMRDGSVSPEDQELLAELRKRLRLPSSVATALFRYAVDEYEAGLLPPSLGPTMPRIVEGARALLGTRTPTDRESRRLGLLQRMAAEREADALFPEVPPPHDDLLTSMQGEVVPELMEVDWGAVEDLPEPQLELDPDAVTEETPTYDGPPTRSQPSADALPEPEAASPPSLVRPPVEHQPSAMPPVVPPPGSRAIRYLVRRYRSRQLRTFVHEADNDLAALRSLLITGVYVLLVLGALVRGGFFEGVEVAGWGAALALGVYLGRVLHLKLSQRHLEWSKSRT